MVALEDDSNVDNDLLNVPSEKPCKEDFRSSICLQSGGKFLHLLLIAQLLCVDAYLCKLCSMYLFFRNNSQ